MRSPRFTRAITTQSRRRSRGAALVEAAVVIPVMLVFLGVIMFTARSYNEKIDQQTTLRSDTLTFASHNCSGGGGALSVDNSPAIASEVEGLGKVADKLSLAGSGVLPGTATGRKSSVVYGSAVNDGRRVAVSRPVRSLSKVGCNQRAHEGTWDTILGLAGPIVKSGGKGIF